MTEIIEIGTISSRGQIAIPSDIRREMKMEEGQKIIFFAEDDTLLIKKVTSQTFREITRTLKEAAKKAGLKESDVSNIIHKFRKSKK